MSGDASIFTKFQKRKFSKVIFGENSRGNMIGGGKIGKNSTNDINDVYLVDGLKYNML